MSVCVAAEVSLYMISLSSRERRVPSTSELVFRLGEKGEVLEAYSSTLGDSGVTRGGLYKPITTSSSSSSTTPLVP